MSKRFLMLGMSELQFQNAMSGFDHVVFWSTRARRVSRLMYSKTRTLMKMPFLFQQGRHDNLERKRRSSDVTATKNTVENIIKNTIIIKF